VTASISVRKHGEVNSGAVLYRWEADQRSGYVLFEVLVGRFRPADELGRPIGDLALEPASDELSGTTAGVDVRLFIQAVVAIRRAYRKAGAIPTRAHAYYY
jgi:hypothetical protein